MIGLVKKDKIFFNTDFDQILLHTHSGIARIKIGGIINRRKAI